jgi:hypothetical protein
MRVVSTGVREACNDKEQIQLLLAQLTALPASLDRPKELLADTGHYSARNVEACQAQGIAPFIAVKRDAHPPAPRERFTKPAAPPADATPVQNMAHKLKTRADRALYARLEANRRTRLWHHQIRAGIPSVLLAWFEESHGRMDLGLHRLEFEAHGRIASAVGKQDRSIAFRDKSTRFRPKTPTFVPNHEIRSGG